MQSIHPRIEQRKEESMIHERIDQIASPLH